MLYRFISLESFLDMILNQHLIFVHPSLWEDPYEQEIISNWWKGIDREKTVEKILSFILSNNIYSQSWSKLDESDALWRIYSHNNTSIRISVSKEKISLLNNVEIKPITYVENQDIFTNKEKDFYDIITKKRRAFSHEEEVRLITHMKFPFETEKIEKIIIDFLKITDEDKVAKFFKDKSIDESVTEIKDIIKSFNINLDKKINQVSFDHIPNFIDSVMLNPFAPDWFNETLSQLCKNYNINYLGKSKLYDVIINE